jgi:anti-sigma regulatory factor (Ser/Thr protein kinase)
METVLSAQARQSVIAVADSSQVSGARRAACDLAAHLGFGETATGEVALVVTEAATNLLKHAGHGEILLRALQRDGQSGIEVLALDQGPGMRNVGHLMEDGTSTAGSFGVGLGAMRRLSQVFDIFSGPGLGTAILMELWAARSAPAPAWLESGVVCLPLAPEPVPGDSWALALGATEGTVLVADGLGHGPSAAQAADAACALLEEMPVAIPDELLDEAHHRLRATRGAAVGAVRLDAHRETLTFAGVGNIAAHVQAHGERRQLVSHNGIVGSNMRKIQSFELPWHEGDLLIMHSDGLASRWDLDAYPGLLSCHPALIAGVLYRDHTRKRDDVTVLVLRYREGP